MKAAFPILALLLLTGCQGYKIENGKCIYFYNEEGSRVVRAMNGADQNSFVPITKVYAKDSKNVYWEGDVVQGADPSTFVPLDWEYGRDKLKVFWHIQEIEGADPDSFKIIRDYWARDKVAYYNIRYSLVDNYVSKKMVKLDCDYSTLTILNLSYAIDKNRAYYTGSPIDGVDVKTFQLTSSLTAKDKYHRYRGQRVLPLK